MNSKKQAEFRGEMRHNVLVLVVLRLNQRGIGGGELEKRINRRPRSTVTSMHSGIAYRIQSEISVLRVSGTRFWPSTCQIIIGISTLCICTSPASSSFRCSVLRQPSASHSLWTRAVCLPVAHVTSCTLLRYSCLIAST